MIKSSIMLDPSSTINIMFLIKLKFLLLLLKLRWTLEWTVPVVSLTGVSLIPYDEAGSH